MIYINKLKCIFLVLGLALAQGVGQGTADLALGVILDRKAVREVVLGLVHQKEEVAVALVTVTNILGLDLDLAAGLMSKKMVVLDGKIKTLHIYSLW